MDTRGEDHDVLWSVRTRAPPTFLRLPGPNVIRKTFFVVSAWHPAGEPTPLRTNLDRHGRLMDHATALDDEAVATTAYTLDRSWAEPAVIVPTRDVAFRLAVEFESPAVVKYENPRSATVYRTDGTVYGNTFVHRRPRRSGCPILNHPEADRFCKMHGGPFGSHAIAAAADWRAPRAPAEHARLRHLRRRLGARFATISEVGRSTWYTQASPRRYGAGRAPTRHRPARVAV